MIGLPSLTDPILLLKLLVLLGFANGTPIFATKLLKDRLAAPLDCGLTLADGHPLFGAAKTIRGIVVSILCTAVAATVLGLDWTTGATLAAASMVGDLTSSFLKRRLGFEVHAQVFGLDQLPEALFPLLFLQSRLHLSAMDIAVGVAAFILYELAFSYLLFRLHIRERPF